MRIKLEFNIHDIWIGCYWKDIKYYGKRIGRTEIYICIIPCFPIHLIFAGDNS